MSFAYAPYKSPERSFCAGATRGKLTLSGANPLVETNIGSMRAFASPFTPGGANKVQRGAETVVSISQPGEGRVALLLGDCRVRQVDGHTPKVWLSSSASKAEGVLVVCDPGFQLESKGLNARRWRRWEVQMDGSLKEVQQKEEILD